MYIATRKQYLLVAMKTITYVQRFPSPTVPLMYRLFMALPLIQTKTEPLQYVRVHFKHRCLDLIVIILCNFILSQGWPKNNILDKIPFCPFTATCKK